MRHLTLTYPDAYNIVSFDKLDYCSSLNNTRVLNDKRNFTFYQGDITNPSEVVDCLERYSIDTIFHFAAQSHVDLSFGNSYNFTHTNVYGTHVLLESAKKVNIRRFIHISTDEVYGEVRDDDDDLLETSILAPTNPYAASKAAAEMLVHSYQKSFKLPAIIVRSNNVYGPHQYPESEPPIPIPISSISPQNLTTPEIIPKFTCLLNRSQPMVLHGDGSPTRRYLYAGDAADAFDTILHRGALGQIYNVPSSDEISNLSLCSRLLDEMSLGASAGAGTSWIKYTHDRPFNDHRYAVDGSKLRRLGWEQKTSFEEGLKATVQWYRVFGERWWGDISKVLCPFPVVDGLEVHSDREDVSDVPQPAGFPSAGGVNGVNGANGANGANGVEKGKKAVGGGCEVNGKAVVNGENGENRGD